MGHRLMPVGDEIGAGQHRQDAGQRHRRRFVDRDDPGMGVRRAQHRHMGLLGKAEIVGVAASAHQQPRVLAAPQGDADPAACARGVHAFLPRPCSQSPTRGFTTANPAKRLKSRSADHSSRTPCWRHKAATRASWTCGPATRPASSSHSATTAANDLARPGRWPASGRPRVRVRRDGEKLMQAGPRNCPACRPVCEFCDAPKGCFVERRILAMRVDEDVGVDGDHAPRSSYAASRSLSHDAPRNSACSPFPLKLARRSLKGARSFESATTRCSPRSNNVLRVTPSRAARLRTSRNSGSEISTVVFTGSFRMGLMRWESI